MEEFEERFSIEIEREKFDTVGGYVVEHLGRVPAAGERIKVGGIEMQVVIGDQRAIRQLRIFPAQPNTASEPG